MNISVLHAEMTYTKDSGYVGKVQFAVEGHKNEYEMALQSKKARDWGYGLFFLHESGNEDDLNAVEDELEENDEWFDFLVEAAMKTLEE